MSSPSTSRNGSTSAASPRARRRSGGPPCRRASADDRRLLDLLDRPTSAPPSSSWARSPSDFPALVARIREAGHEVGSHGHRHQRVYELGAGRLRARSRSASQRAGGGAARRRRLFRAPEWSINDRSLWALETLARQGFTVDASMAPLKIVGRVAIRGIRTCAPRRAGRFVEVPPLVAAFRAADAVRLGLGPAHEFAATRPACNRAAQSSRAPAVLTVHPWEIDPDPPRVRLPAVSVSPTTSGWPASRRVSRE